MTLDDRIQQAHKIIDEAWGEHEPIRLFAGMSGGHESLITTHLVLNHRPDATVLHVNTGIGIEQTRQFVRDTCRDYDWLLWERKTPESYEEFVLAHGFPGPAQHPRMYQRLKERVIEATVREAKREEMLRLKPEDEWYRDAVRWCSKQQLKHERHAELGNGKADDFWTDEDVWTDEHIDRAYGLFTKPWRVMICTGIRAAESLIRAGYKRTVTKVWAQVWVNPIYHFTDRDVEAYMERFNLPRNPVKDTLGMSGECLCSAFADWSERVIIKRLDPETDAYLTDLEEKVWASGLPWKWGDPGPPDWYKKAQEGQGMMFDPAPDCPWKERLAAGEGMSVKEWEAWTVRRAALLARQREIKHLVECEEELSIEEFDEWVAIASELTAHAPSSERDLYADSHVYAENYVGPMCHGCGKDGLLPSE